MRIEKINVKDENHLVNCYAVKTTIPCLDMWYSCIIYQIKLYMSCSEKALMELRNVAAAQRFITALEVFLPRPRPHFLNQVVQ